MQPVMVEHHLDDEFVLGTISAVNARVVERKGTREDGIELVTRKKIGNSEVIKKEYVIGRPLYVLFHGGHLHCFLKGDIIHLNGTPSGNGTGLTFYFNHLPKQHPLRRMRTSFRHVDKIYADTSRV